MKKEIVDQFVEARRTRQAQRIAQKIEALGRANEEGKKKLDAEFERRKAHLIGAYDGYEIVQQTREETYRREVERLLEVKASGTPILLGKWLRFDKWSPDQAFMLMCGFEPEHCLLTPTGDIAEPEYSFPTLGGSPTVKFNAITLENVDLDMEASRDVYGMDSIRHLHDILRFGFRRLKETWESGDRLEQRHSPADLIGWAVNKKFHISWLSWAQAEGLLPESFAARPLEPHPEETGDLDLPGDDLGGDDANDARVYYRIFIKNNLNTIDAHYGGRAKVTDVMRWVKKNGGDRIVSDTNDERLTWRDDSGNPQVATKKAVSNYLSRLRPKKSKKSVFEASQLPT